MTYGPAKDLISMVSSLVLRVNSFFYGLTLPIKAAKLIKSQRALVIWAILPIGITFILYYFLIQGLQDTANDYMKGLYVSLGWDTKGWMVWFASIFATIIIWIIAALTFAFSSSILASPFNDILAEKTERHTDPPMTPVGKQGLKQQIHLIGIDLVKTIASAIVGFFAIIVSWIPIVNLLSFTLVFLLVCFQYISYPQTRRDVPLRDGFNFLRQYFFACLGFGISITFLFAIPFVSSFVLPLAVVSGTLLVGKALGGHLR
jgi:uncharacterized protein involved in cysteine biosynthesis